MGFQATFGRPGRVWHKLRPFWMRQRQIWSLLEDVDWPPIQGSMVRLEVKSSYTFEAPMVSALHKILWVPGIWVAYKVMSQKTKNLHIWNISHFQIM